MGRVFTIFSQNPKDVRVSGNTLLPHAQKEQSRCICWESDGDNLFYNQEVVYAKRLNKWPMRNKLVKILFHSNDEVKDVFTNWKDIFPTRHFQRHTV